VLGTDGSLALDDEDGGEMDTNVTDASNEDAFD
jgi:hypothetical protein